MTDFFRKRGREKLYKQWTEKAGLSPDDLPADLKREALDSDAADDNSHDENSPRRNFPSKADRAGHGLFTFVDGRLVLILVSIIAILLVIVSVLSTILALRGC